MCSINSGACVEPISELRYSETYARIISRDPPKSSSPNKATMSYQALLDLPGATARSKGQARRRNQPSLSDDARKNQRNFARRERARCKRIGRTGQPHV